MPRGTLLAIALLTTGFATAAPTASACGDVNWSESHDLFGVEVVYYGNNECECDVGPWDVNEPHNFVPEFEPTYDEICHDSKALVDALDELDPNNGP